MVGHVGLQTCASCRRRASLITSSPGSKSCEPLRQTHRLYPRQSESRRGYLGDTIISLSREKHQRWQSAHPNTSADGPPDSCAQLQNGPSLSPSTSDDITTYPSSSPSFPTPWARCVLDCLPCPCCFQLRFRLCLCSRIVDLLPLISIFLLNKPITNLGARSWVALRGSESGQTRLLLLLLVQITPVIELPRRRATLESVAPHAYRQQWWRERSQRPYLVPAAYLKTLASPHFQSAGNDHGSGGRSENRYD